MEQLQLQDIDLQQIKSKFRDDDSPDSYCSTCSDRAKSVIRWSKSQELLITGWSEQCYAEMLKHKSVEKKYRRFNTIIGMLSVFLPVCTGIVYEFSGEELVIVILLVCDAIVTTISQFRNYGELSQRHSEFANKYQDLIMEIDIELTKPKHKRREVMEFISNMRGEISKTQATAPFAKSISSTTRTLCRKKVRKSRATLNLTKKNLGRDIENA